MGKWDQGEYNRVCADKFKRLFYVSQDKDSSEYDVDVERDWKQFLKTLDPEKKTVQACFSSLVNATKAPICPRHHLHHVHRAGPSVHIPRAFRHYDTSDARTTRRTRPATMARQPGSSTYFVSDEIVNPQDTPETEAIASRMIPPPRLRQWANPALENTIASAPRQPGDDVISYREYMDRLTQAHRQQATQATTGDGMEVFAEIGRLADEETQEMSQPTVNRLPILRPISPHYENDEGRQYHEERDMTRSMPYGAWRVQDVVSRVGNDLSLASLARIPATNFDDLDASYPLFAPLDDAGPYPNEEIFDAAPETRDGDEDDSSSSETYSETIFHPSASDAHDPATQAPGYTDWSLPGLDETYGPDIVPNINHNHSHAQHVTRNANIELNPAAPWVGPSTSNLASRADQSSDQYLVAARQAINHALGIEHVTSERFPLPHTFDQIEQYVRGSRRQREDDEDETEGQGGPGVSGIERRPLQRSRLNEESGTSEGSPQRVRRSIPVESLLSATGSGSGGGSGIEDNRRNGVVFDAESYINPDL